MSDLIDSVIVRHLRRLSPAFADAFARLHEQLRDADRVRYMRAVMEDIGGDIPIDRMVTAYNEGQRGSRPSCTLRLVTDAN